MHVVALVKSEDHVCCRYRMTAFRSAFADVGHMLDIRSWSGRWFVQQLLPFHEIDALIIQRKLFPTWQLNSLRRRARVLIYDFDDSIFLNSSYNPDGHDCPRRFHQFKQMLHAADVVIAGNRFLAEQAKGFTAPGKVRIIPTCVDVSRYTVARHEANVTQLAWIGSSSTVRGLERIGNVLDRLGKEVAGLELKIICDRSIALRILPVRFAQWHESTETAELASADIGISWLPDDAWSEGKCGLKILQYMAAGLPVVANPVGVQRTMVRHGETGFLVETPDDWLQAIRWLARDPDLRRTMGRAGRRLVETKYDVSIGGALWQRLLTTLDRSSLASAI